MFKWFCVICVVIFPIIPLFFKLRKFARHKDRYSLEYRYEDIRKFVKKLNKAFKKRIHCHNYEIINNPHGGRIYICNHQSMDDVLTLFELSKKPLAFISKIENKNIIALGNAIKAIECFSIDRDDARQSLRVLRDAAKAAQDGRDILLFPEGTRSLDGEILEFKSALSMLVGMAKVETVIIAIDGTAKTLKRTRYKKVDISVRVCEPISYEQYLEHKNDFNEYCRDIMKNELAIIRNEGK